MLSTTHSDMEGLGESAVESGSMCSGSVWSAAKRRSPSPTCSYAVAKASCSLSRALSTLSSWRRRSSFVIVTAAINGCSGFKKTPGFSMIVCLDPVCPTNMSKILFKKFYTYLYYRNHFYESFLVGQIVVSYCSFIIL